MYSYTPIHGLYIKFDVSPGLCTYIWLQRDPIHGGRLQAHLWLVRHKRASHPQIQHNSARTGRFDRPRYPAHVERTRAIHAEGCSRHMAIPSAEAGWRLLLKACSEHRRGGETGAAQQEGEGKGIAHALPRMLGRGRARTLIILSACATLYPQRPNRAIVQVESCVRRCAGTGGAEGGLN